MPDQTCTKPSDFSDFRALAAALGQDPLYVQGAGGNVSIKHGDAIWVKASGAWLKDAADRNIFTVIDYTGSRVQLDQPTEPAYRRLDNDAALRPSIETSLHITLPHRIVVHVHAVTALALAVRLDAEALCKQKLAGMNYAFVPYVTPGWPLMQALRDLLKSAAPNVFVLGNHGLVVGGETVAEVKALLADVNARLQMPIRAAPSPDLTFLGEFKGTSWRLPQSVDVHALATDTASLEYAAGGTLYPDHVVFLGRGCRTVDSAYVLAADPKRHPMILINGKGVLLGAELSSAGEAMAECLAAVLSRIPQDARLNYLTSRNESELLSSNAEKYRQAIA